MPSAVEYIASITEVGTTNVYSCVSSANKARQEVKMPFDRKSAAFEMSGSDGGYNPRGHFADPAGMRAVDVNLIVEYESINGRDTFTKCISEFVKFVAHGRECEIAFVDSDGSTIRNGYGHCIHFDKGLVKDNLTWCIIPFRMLMPNPILRAKFKTGTLLADNGLFADATPTKFADTDPDTYALTGTHTTHTITNMGSYPDRVPVITLTAGSGAIVGPIGVANLAIPDIGGIHYQFIYQGTILPGESVTFDCGQFDVYSSISSFDAYNLFAPLSTIPDGEWFRIDPGPNPIYIDYASAGSGSYANIDWRDSTI